jgi:hypothetical protein
MIRRLIILFLFYLLGLFGLHVQWCTPVFIAETPATPLPPTPIWAHIRGRYWSDPWFPPLS